MAQSLKTNYLMLALAVVALLASVLGSLAYYEHRSDTNAVNYLTAATVGQKLEADLAERAQHLAARAGSLLSGTLSAGNAAGTRAIAERLLQESDVERVEVTDASGQSLFAGSHSDKGRAGDGASGAGPSELSPPTYESAVISPRDPHAAPIGHLRIWMSRTTLDETLAGLRSNLEAHQAIQGKRMSGGLIGLILLLLTLGLSGAWFIARQLARPIRVLVKTAARAHAAKFARNDDHEELSEHGLEQLERRRARRVARRHRAQL
jgi:hypothetical protein